MNDIPVVAARRPALRRAVALLVVAALLPAGAALARKKKTARKPPPAARDSAESLRQARQSLEQKRRREAALKPEIQERERQERSVLAELDRRARELSGIRGEIGKFNEEIAYTEAQLAAVRTRQRATAGELAQSHGALAELLRAWQTGDDESLAREVAVWHGRAQADRLSSARLTRYELEQSEARQSEYLANLTRLRRDKAAKERAMAATRRAQRELLERVRLEKFQKQAEERELADQRRNLERVVDRYAEEVRRREMPRVPAAARVGQLGWPVRGAIARRYGRQTHQEFNATVFSTGIEIRAAEGSPVKAAESGRVAYADWLQGYGRVMIVDHGSGFYTLYGHLEDVRLSAGAPVERGAVLGTVGESASLGTPTLYFEVRQNGRPVDPLSYLGRSAS